MEILCKGTQNFHTRKLGEIMVFYAVNITLSPNGTSISCVIDTNAQCNVIFVESLENISPKPDLQSVNVKLSACNGSKNSSRWQMLIDPSL